MSSYHILLVDDDDLNRMSLVCVLEAWGYTISETRSGKDALQAVATKSYDLILMDLKMPDMHGFEVTKRMRSHGVTCPIIGLTGLGEHAACIKSGMTDMLLKPIEMDTLKAKIESLLSS